MPRIFKDASTTQYRPRWKDLDLYERVESVPEGLKWSPMRGSGKDENVTLLRSMGDYYRLIRWRKTGEVAYFKRKDDTPAKSPSESIDAEPAPPKQQRFPKGAQAWFVDAGRWFLVEVVERTTSPARITIKSVTGFDADRAAPWEFGDVLEFPANDHSPLFGRLRKLAARYP